MYVCMYVFIELYSGKSILPTLLRIKNKLEIFKNTMWLHYFSLHVIIIHVDLFSLYVLFSHFRPHDGTPENWFFWILLYA